MSMAKQSKKLDKLSFGMLSFILSLVAAISGFVYFGYYKIIAISEIDSEGNTITTWVRDYPRDVRIVYSGLIISIGVAAYWLAMNKKGRLHGFLASANDNIADIKKRHLNLFKNHRLYYILFSTMMVPVSLFFLSLFVSLVFFNNSSPFPTGVISMPGQVIMAFIFAFGAYVVYSIMFKACILLKSGNISLTAFSALILCLLFPLQLYFVINISTSIGWDVGVMIWYASAAAPMYSVYLSISQNNLLLFFILRVFVGIFRLIGLSDFWLGLSVINIVFVNMSMLFSVITLQKINMPEKATVIFIILFALLLSFTPWLIVPYSDIYLMPIVSGFVLSIICAVKAESMRKKIILSIVCGILFAVGWLIKAFIIAVVAGFIVLTFLFIALHKKQISIKSVYPIAVGTAISVLSLVCFNFFLHHQDIVRLNHDIRSPASYAIATGLVRNPAGQTRYLYGAWTSRVAHLVDRSSATTEEQNEAYWQFILAELESHGVAGYAGFLFNKARWITSEGHFFWLREGGTADFSNHAQHFLRELVYTTGRLYSFWQHMANGIWIIIFLGLVIGIYHYGLVYKDKLSDESLMFMLIILTVFFSIFGMLFIEARSRYLISFLPLYCMVSAYGYAAVSDMAKSIKKVR